MFQRQQIRHQCARVSGGDADAGGRCIRRQHANHLLAGRGRRLVLEQEGQRRHDRPRHQRARLIQVKQLPLRVGQTVADIIVLACEIVAASAIRPRHGFGRAGRRQQVVA